MPKQNQNQTKTEKTNPSYIICISGKRSLKSHHLGDNQVLAFLLYEMTERFRQEPERLFLLRCFENIWEATLLVLVLGACCSEQPI